MEVSIGCGTAAVSVMDQNFSPIVEFGQVQIVGGNAFCGDSNLTRKFNRLSDRN
jgi:hypothetical protein